MDESISELERAYLEMLRNGPFDPIGWLYRSVFADLARRGLCRERFDGFHLTVHGLELIDDGVRRG